MAQPRTRLRLGGKHGVRCATSGFGMAAARPIQSREAVWKCVRTFSNGLETAQTACVASGRHTLRLPRAAPACTEDWGGIRGRSGIDARLV